MNSVTFLLVVLMTGTAAGSAAHGSTTGPDAAPDARTFPDDAPTVSAAPGGTSLPDDAPTVSAAFGVTSPPDDVPTPTSKPDITRVPENGSPPAAADVAPWPKRNFSIGVWDAVASGALVAGVVTVQFGVSSPSQAKWASTGFDDWVRGWLRIKSEGGRKAAATTSDVLLYTLTAAPFLNAFLVAGVEHERMDVAWKLAALDAETLLTALFVSLSLEKATARERPFVPVCKSNPTLSECSSGSANASFPSGHTTVVFTAVSLECFHHGYLDTSHTAWGAVACPVSIAAATVTGILRIAADRHWATDVIAGAVLGGAIGYAVPALHLAFGEENTAIVTPSVSPSYLGLTLAGRF
jgi:membrane-associated phospholipid phosphatase